MKTESVETLPISESSEILSVEEIIAKGLDDIKVSLAQYLDNRQQELGDNFYKLLSNVNKKTLKAIEKMKKIKI